jgi:hypothetical protein
VQDVIGDVPVAEVHAHAVGEMVAVVIEGIIATFVEDGTKLLYHKLMKSLPAARCMANGHHLRRLSPHSLARTNMNKITIEEVLLPKDHNTRVPHAVELL